jgi:diaminopimelate decarboxylase/aspartate kinase
MPSQWRILKFGGTSVAGPRQWAAIASLVSERLRNGDRVLLVCSALAGITNRLDALSRQGADREGIIHDVLDAHAVLADALDIEAVSLLAKTRARLEERSNAQTLKPSPQNKAALLALGEWMSSRLGELYLAGKLDVAWVDARDALQAVEPDPELAEKWGGLGEVLITQGYVAGTTGGRPVLLGRGGSDTSAALLASRLSAGEVEIWTDVPGLFSADPSREPDAMLIRELDYNEALEMAASGARVVHPRCIRAASDAGLVISIRDLSRPKLEGTRISGTVSAINESAPLLGAKAVTCQDGMLVMLLENLDTRQQVGFLAWVFEAIAARGLSVDLVATSETTTTLAINSVDNPIDDKLVSDISTRLSERCRVRVFQDCCCVNLVGRGVRTALLQFGAATGSLSEWPLLMLSLSANDLCLSLLVYPQHAQSLLHDLHQCLVVDSGNAGNPVYGPAWNELERSG